MLLNLQPMADRMRLEATVNDMVNVLELKDGEMQWEYRLNLFRPADDKKP